MDTKIHIWHTGSVYIDKSLAFNEKSWHPVPYTGWFRGQSKKIWVPVSTYLIEHPKGKVLIDTGWHEDIRVNQKKHLGRFTYSMFKGKLPRGQSIKEKIDALGIETKDLDYVVLTHLHSDHVSGLEHVSNAKNILTSELEWQAAQKDLGYIKTMWRDIPINTFHLNTIPFGPYKKGYDLFGDETIYLVFTPGHSKGQMSILVSTTKGWILLASDVGYAERSWKEYILPGLMVDKQAAQKSLKWVQEFSRRKDCYRVIANHDPSIREENIT
ncbi:glyoxylase-like metal-dependent hydrolase (beta-lactamase superfamily II) [Salibacterium salarium]|uniref:N-acyl homoserine lactonase family protein n=1 Tax=Salibacterium salarium TaxID=284579 RepID=UPI0027832789|nr:N-acyl homoserine lactonase family protein [Salibacterium salarium]MDQ0297846.1 glyoxylase-like metal-dependent hydrolase (beta-lactamase superfamily II) [Salibacterium salarium]